MRQGFNAAASYRLLAEALAVRGVTTVRIDKRGLAGSAAATVDGNAVIRQLTGAHCIWLLGLYEGGRISLAAAKSQGDLCGLILVATAGRPRGELLRGQLQANPANAPLLGQALPADDDLEACKRVDTTSMPTPLARL